MQLYVISVKHGSTLNATILIIWITNIYKIVKNRGIASHVPQCSFHLVIWTIKSFYALLITIIIMNQKIQIVSLSETTPWFSASFQPIQKCHPWNNSDAENVIQSKYYDTYWLQQLKIPNKETSLSFFLYQFLFIKHKFCRTLNFTAINKYSVWCNGNNWKPNN